MITDLLSVIMNTTFMFVLSLVLAICNYMGYITISFWLILLPIIINVSMYALIALFIYCTIKYYNLEKDAIMILQRSELSYNEKLIILLELISQNIL